MNRRFIKIVKCWMVVSIGVRVNRFQMNMRRFCVVFVIARFPRDESVCVCAGVSIFSFCMSFVCFKRGLNRDKHPTLGTLPLKISAILISTIWRPEKKSWFIACSQLICNCQSFTINFTLLSHTFSTLTLKNLFQFINNRSSHIIF